MAVASQSAIFLQRQTTLGLPHNRVIKRLCCNKEAMLTNTTNFWDPTCTTMSYQTRFWYFYSGKNVLIMQGITYFS